MAQGNMLLGMARGSVGDVTFARSARKQVSRARNRKPNNPRTLAQCKQRVLLKTAALAYQLFQKDIADQTFEGAMDARENQQKFMRYNVAQLRSLVSGATSLYAGKGATECPINKYVLSKGSLNGSAFPGVQDNKFLLQLPSPPLPATATYRDFAAALGVPVGSQLTAVVVKSQDGENYNEVGRYRLILSPSDGDVDKVMWVSDALNDPNEKNIGDWVFDNTPINPSLSPLGNLGRVGYGCIIVSHFDKKWRYSDASISFPSTVAPKNNYDEAVESWYNEGKTSSTEYTRQAE